MEHPNAELYRRVTTAFQSGDIAAVADACSGSAVARSWQPRGHMA
jgi:hypothetical protein